MRSALKAGTVPFLDGVRQLTALRFHVNASGFDKDFMPFVAVDSETDHLPPASALTQCSSEWLAKCEAEVKEVIERYETPIFDACDRLIQRFSS
jgi:hypothetical protein